MPISLVWLVYLQNTVRPQCEMQVFTIPMPINTILKDLLNKTSEEIINLLMKKSPGCSTAGTIIKQEQVKPTACKQRNGLI